MSPSHETWPEYVARRRAHDLRVQLFVAACGFAAFVGLALLCWIG